VGLFACPERGELIGITIIEQQTMHAIQQMSRHLGRIADCMEAAEKRAQEAVPPVEAEIRRRLAAVQETTVEDIEAMGAALTAVRRGFADIEDAAIPDLTDQERKDFTDALEEKP
jgi:hypothetical protein